LSSSTLPTLTRSLLPQRHILHFHPIKGKGGRRREGDARGRRGEGDRLREGDVSVEKREETGRDREKSEGDGRKGFESGGREGEGTSCE
jgi:hypothetical protein